MLTTQHQFNAIMKHVTVGAFAALLLVLALVGRVSCAGVVEEEVEVEDSSHSSRELHHVGPAPVLEEYELDPTCDYEAVMLHNTTPPRTYVQQEMTIPLLPTYSTRLSKMPTE